jgi:flagellar hook assembly protein FlgD
MNKLFISIFIGLFCGLIGGHFITKYLFTSETISQDYVRVTIINSTGQTIKKVILEHENGTYEISKLLDKNETKVIFRNAGEGSYKVTASFENDSTLKSKEVYIEGGYRMTETITAKDIKTTYDR